MTQHEIKPNIVLFVAEDLDFEGVNCYDAAQTGFTGVIRAGNPNFPEMYTVDNLLTPALDGFAASGFKSSNYYCVSAICTPARYAILTGRYPERSPHFCEIYPPHTQANIYFNIGMTRGETNVAKVLRQNGYRTGMVGKWHNFPQHIKLRLKDMNDAIPKDANPRDPGVQKAITAWYETAVAYLRDGFGWDSVDRVYYDNPEPFHPRALGSHNLEWIIEGALDFLEQNRDSTASLFLYVPVTTPHSRYRGDIFDQSDPLATPAGMLERAPRVMMPRQEIVQRVADAGLPAYAREGLWLDEGFNAILRKLKEIGQEEHTCVIFTTDHPTASKETCHLGRIPFLARWPGKIAPGTESGALLAQIDLAPTILDIAGCDVPADMHLDGQSCKPLLLGQTVESHRDRVLLEVVNSRALVSGPWKYIANRWPNYLPAIADINKTGWLGTARYDNACIRDSVPYQADKLWPAYFRADQLYHIETDPCEQRDLSEDPAYAETLTEMRQKLWAELAKLPHAFGEFERAGF